MNATRVNTPTSRCRLGIGRCDITPPVGIYHRFWGAAAHDQATGVHRPLEATVVLIGPGPDAGQSGGGDQGPFAIVALDHCLLRPPEMDELLQATAAQIGVPVERITFVFSHTHSAAHLSRARAEMPGGDLIGPYLDALPRKIAEAHAEARRSWSPVTISYAQTLCDMAHQRDFQDPETGAYLCGFNPRHGQTGYPLQVLRAQDEQGGTVATLVHYPCHPTTLAWENTLISPDYVGALRDTVERETGAPCVFLLGACGDVGPKFGFVGTTEVADRNGRQVGWAALAALESLPGRPADFEYTGPVVSGATLATWAYGPQDATRQQQSRVFRSRSWTVDVPYPPEQPTLEQTRAAMRDLQAQEDQARARGANQEARDLRALVERKRRLLDRLEPLPAGSHYPYPVRAWQLGDAFWVAVEGEPYHELQRALSRRFPGHPLLVIPLANGSRCSYLPTQEAFQLPLYQVEVAMLAAGCLEAVIESVAALLAEWLGEVVG